MPRGRDKPYRFSGQDRAPPYQKRRGSRPPPGPLEEEVVSTPLPCPALRVLGLPPSCSVLNLKSAFEIYGAISRTRIESNGVGSVTFRSKESAEAAIAASSDASFGITVGSKRVQVLWATDPLAQWREGVTSQSKLANPRATSSSDPPRAEFSRGSQRLNPSVDGEDKSDVNPRPREIVAYDDIL